MTESDIKIDKEGLWYYRGAHMFRKDILSIFFNHLNIDACGRYYIQLNDEVCYLDVEDTVFVITSVLKTKNPSDASEKLEILTSDDERETLDAASLTVGCDHVMYCRIKEGRFIARFTRKSYYQLAEFIEQDEPDGHFYVRLNDKKHYIGNR
ncbi:MAG: DUF1285 domain-containing protein [Smithellaceae bacterium]|nr:DUF1285 domain-containing protein [Syntrophaceae bacterium]MDD4240078.1 DUF1285 domain-containing protein [Smithellaceae bacterium]NLX51442.1 DUF1285 domain-containing protein [Deltaproteobacteria bacterium]